MGQIRRTLRSWKEDISNIWGKLKTFHRIAVGIMLAMVMIYIAREKLLDPLQTELTECYKQMDQKGVPQVVPEVQEDSEVIELNLTLENLINSVRNWQGKKNSAVSLRPQVSRDDYAQALADFETLILKSGMALRNRFNSNVDTDVVKVPSASIKKKNNQPEPAVTTYPLPCIIYDYELSGSFVSVCQCLSSIQTFRYPSKVNKLEVKLSENTSASTASGSLYDDPLIIIRFRLELYYNEQ